MGIMYITPSITRPCSDLNILGIFIFNKAQIVRYKKLENIIISDNNGLRGGS